MHLVIFDLETTGYSPRYHEIIQIAAVRMRHGKINAEERFETFVRPKNGIPGFISELTGIMHSDVCDAPEPGAALMAFSRFVGDEHWSHTTAGASIFPSSANVAFATNCRCAKCRLSIRWLYPAKHGKTREPTTSTRSRSDWVFRQKVCADTTLAAMFGF